MLCLSTVSFELLSFCFCVSGNNVNFEMIAKTLMLRHPCLLLLLAAAAADAFFFGGGGGGGGEAIDIRRLSKIALRVQLINIALSLKKRRMSCASPSLEVQLFSSCSMPSCDAIEKNHSIT